MEEVVVISVDKNKARQTKQIRQTTKCSKKYNVSILNLKTKLTCNV